MRTYGWENSLARYATGNWPLPAKKAAAVPSKGTPPALTRPPAFIQWQPEVVRCCRAGAREKQQAGLNPPVALLIRRRTPLVWRNQARSAAARCCKSSTQCAMIPRQFKQGRTNRLALNEILNGTAQARWRALPCSVLQEKPRPCACKSY